MPRRGGLDLRPPGRDGCRKGARSRVDEELCVLISYLCADAVKGKRVYRSRPNRPPSARRAARRAERGMAAAQPRGLRPLLQADKDLEPPPRPPPPRSGSRTPALQPCRCGKGHWNLVDNAGRIIMELYIDVENVKHNTERAKCGHCGRMAPPSTACPRLVRETATCTALPTRCAPSAYRPRESPADRRVSGGDRGSKVHGDRGAREGERRAKALLGGNNVQGPSLVGGLRERVDHPDSIHAADCRASRNGSRCQLGQLGHDRRDPAGRAAGRNGHRSHAMSWAASAATLGVYAATAASGRMWRRRQARARAKDT